MKWPFLLFVMFVLLLGLGGCGTNEPILIGLAVELTGKQADVGINIRDAAQMAVDEINAQGGIDGRPLELLVRDDEGKPEVARQVDQELVDAGVVAIIGHYTSGQTAAVFEQMNNAGVVLISPSSSSSEFSGKADHFFRLTPDTAFFGHYLGKYIGTKPGIKKLLGVYDDNNRAFSQVFWEAVEAGYSSSGGGTQLVIFNSKQADMQQVAAQIKDAVPDAVVITASSVDTAVLAQYLRQAGVDVPLFSSSWAQTPQLMQKGGHAVENLELIGIYNPGSQIGSHRLFVQKFQERFGREPQLGTSQAYECVMVLATALKRTGGKGQGLREALESLKDFPGVQGAITFNAFGDVYRDVYILRIENGQFVEQETIDAETP